MSLLDLKDKDDLRVGYLTEIELRCHVVAWKDNCMPHLSDMPLLTAETPTPVYQGIVYRKPFIVPPEMDCD